MKFFKSSMIATVSALVLGFTAPASADGPKHIGNTGIQVNGIGFAQGTAGSFGHHTENYTGSTVGFTTNLRAEDCGCIGGVIKGTAGQLSESFAGGPGLSMAGSNALAGLNAGLKLTGPAKKK